MGYTQFTVDQLEEIISNHSPKTILDFGAQNMYNQPELPAPYAKEWYENEKKMKYVSIDINNEHGAIAVDLSKPLLDQTKLDERLIDQYDLVVDAGTTEHVGVDGKHDTEAFYNAWKTKYDLCKNGGIIYSENPKTGSWPCHGFNYHTLEFYHQLGIALGCQILSLGEHAACHNIIDGWNIYCSFIKPTATPFISLEEFKKLTYKLS